MNPNTVNTDWHPGETDDWLREAIDRVRADVALESAEMARGATEGADPMSGDLAHGNGASEPPAVWEWYMNNRPMTQDEYTGALRRMKRRGEYTTDEPIGRGAPTTLTVIRGGKA